MSSQPGLWAGKIRGDRIPDFRSIPPTRRFGESAYFHWITEIVDHMDHLQEVCDDFDSYRDSVEDFAQDLTDAYAEKGYVHEQGESSWTSSGATDGGSTVSAKVLAARRTAVLAAAAARGASSREIRKLFG